MDPVITPFLMLACGFGTFILFGGLLLLGLHAFGPRPRDGLGRARSLLHKRLAAGEIDLEEYYERESALRQAEPPRRRVLGRI